MENVYQINLPFENVITTFCCMSTSNSCNQENKFFLRRFFFSVQGGGSGGRGRRYLTEALGKEMPLGPVNPEPLHVRQ